MTAPERRSCTPVRGSVVASDHTTLAGSGVQAAAVVTLPNHLHAPVAINLLEAGIHVLVSALPLRFSHAAAAAAGILHSLHVRPVVDQDVVSVAWRVEHVVEVDDVM